MTATAEEIKAAALSGAGESGDCTLAPGGDGWILFTLPSGRRGRYHAARRVIELPEADEDTFRYMKQQQGTGFDAQAVLDAIKDRFGVSTDAEANRRALALAGRLLGVL